MRIGLSRPDRRHGRAATLSRLLERARSALLFAALAPLLSACVEINPENWTMLDWFLVIVLVLGVIGALLGGDCHPADGDYGSGDGSDGGGE